MGLRMGLPEYVQLRSALLLLRENDIGQLEVAIASSRDEPYRALAHLRPVVCRCSLDEKIDRWLL